MKKTVTAPKSQHPSISSEYPAESLIDRVIAGDTLEILPKLPDECVDSVFVDPPYFLQLPKKRLKRWSGSDVDGVDDHWDTFKDFNEYDEFTRRYLTELKRIMKPKATIWIIGSYHNIYRVGKILMDNGYWLLNDVVWFKSNPMPNFLGVRFTNSTETLLWALKDKNAKGYTFHKSEAKRFNEGKLGINVWRIPLCSGSERLRDDDGNKTHSTQKPLELLRRVISSSTNPGDLILDPMAGTGTTAVAAKELGRHYLLIERNPDYLKAIAKRLNNANT